MQHEIGQEIQRKIEHNHDDVHEENLQDSDEFDPLRFSELIHSDFKQVKKSQQIHQDQHNEQNQESPRNDRLLKIEPYSSRVSLHEQYPALSRQLQQEEEKNLQRSQKDQQHQEISFRVQIQMNNEKTQQDLHTQLKQSNVSLKPKVPELPSDKKFQKYLNEQIGQMLLNDLNGNRKISQALQSPILLPRSMSLISGDTSFFDPLKNSLNLSRSYIPNFLSLGNPTVYEFSPVKSKQLIEIELKEIFDYYAETYLQPTQYYETFDSVKNRTMSFQSFCLFAKDFKILKTIFSLETIKKVFKKQSEFGKVLQLKNFIGLVEALSHEQQCNTYFRLEITVPDMNAQTRQELQTQQLYAYIGLHQGIEKVREKFSKVFHPFGCKKEAELPRIKYNYRRFSEPDLHKKALPPSKENKKKNLIVLKSNQKYDSSPFDSEKSVVVSWQILKSKTAHNLESIKFSSQKVKKYIKQDPEDKVYLKQYKQAKSIPRYLVERKITQIQQIEEKEKKPHKVIENLEKMENKILAQKLKLKKKLNNKI